MLLGCWVKLGGFGVGFVGMLGGGRRSGFGEDC